MLRRDGGVDTGRSLNRIGKSAKAAELFRDSRVMQVLIGEYLPAAQHDRGHTGKILQRSPIAMQVLEQSAIPHYLIVDSVHINRLCLAYPLCVSVQYISEFRVV